mmetsp:Transcript_27961/g.78755  ORF Transcript_27961/g.78755 Transcript_27961/m.78755 type:complete len:91 (+) Transcript_27961:532-804(+)
MELVKLLLRWHHIEVGFACQRLRAATELLLRLRFTGIDPLPEICPKGCDFLVCRRNQNFNVMAYPRPQGRHVVVQAACVCIQGVVQSTGQ